jgi:ABC-2 type transport system permease protein
MNKTLIIIKREYFSRVKKKSFLIMTLLVPMLIIGMYALIFALTMSGGDNIPTVEVIDESGIFEKAFDDKKSVNFEVTKLSLIEAKKKVINNEDAFVLYIPKDIGIKGSIEMFAQKKAGLSVIRTIERQLNDQMRIKLLKDAGIDSETLDKINPNLSVVSKELTIEGEKDSSSGAAMAVGFAAAILIYMSLFIYGIQVMRGIIEEKTSRIVEVVISSVKSLGSV